MHTNFGVKITITNKAIEELSKMCIINIDMNKYKDNNNYIFDKIVWKTDDFWNKFGTADIYYKDGKTEELQNCEDIFDYDWVATYLSISNNCFYDYIEMKADLDINKLMKLEDKTITDNEVKNWIPGISAVIFDSRIEYI